MTQDLEQLKQEIVLAFTGGKRLDLEEIDDEFLEEAYQRSLILSPLPPDPADHDNISQDTSFT